MRSERQRRTAPRRHRGDGRRDSGRARRAPARPSRPTRRTTARSSRSSATQRRRSRPSWRCSSGRSPTSICARTRGEHPRLGAVDVVPFVPIEGVTMADCVALAKGSAPASPSASACPVYLYEEASTNPARKNLEDIRRGEFEGLAAKMATPGWAPDFGPAAPHPTAGASVIGARMPLIAYNINLATDRLDVAKRDRRRDPPQQRRLPVRQGDGLHARRPRHRPGVDEPDELREDADLPRVRDGEARGRALRRGDPRKRNRRAGPVGGA